MCSSLEMNEINISYLINHHLQEDLKDFVAHSNHTLHHSWSEIKCLYSPRDR